MQEIRGFLSDQRILQFADEFLERSQWSYGAAACRCPGDKFLNGCPERRSFNARGFAKRIHGCFTDTAWW